MNSKKRNYSIGAIILLLFTVLFVWKPISLVSQVNEPDQNPLHIRKVFNESRIGQTVIIPTGYVSEIEIKINKKSLPDNTPVQFLIKNQNNDKTNIRQINTTLAKATKDDQLIFNFKPIIGKKFYFELATPALSEKDCIALRYQIDSEKYPSGQTYINSSPVYGDLAFSTRSSPPAILLIIGYLIKHPTVALAIILLITVVFVSRLKRSNQNINNTTAINFSKELPQIVFVFAFTFLSFVPLFNLYFRQDDFVILDRARTLLAENPLLLLTNRGFIEASRSVLPVHIAFYRPISNSLVPALLYKIFGLNAFFHYAFNFLIHAATAAGIYLIFRQFLNKNISLLITLLWATHSAVFVTVSWLSSVQEILSAFFFVYSLLAFSRFWESGNKKYQITSIFLFLLAILSKENSFLFLAIAPLFVLATNKLIGSFREKLVSLSFSLSPHLICSALILIIRDWMLNEPGLHRAFADNSYTISLKPLVLLGNISASLSWISQSWIFGYLSGNSDIGNYLVKIEETAGWANIPPLSIVLIIFTFIILIGANFAFDNKKTLWWFPPTFYLIASLPFLILLNERQVRWQYFPMLGLILLLGMAMQNLEQIHRCFRSNLFLFLIIVLIALESQWALKNNPYLLEAKTQSAFTRQAISYMRKHFPKLKQSTRIVIRGVPPEREQNLGFAAFSLNYSDASITTIYERENANKQLGDIYLDYSTNTNSVHQGAN